MYFVIRWIINALALMLLPYIFSSIQVANFYAALVTALILGLINAMIRPVLIFLTFPVTILTLGFFILVINGLMFWLATSLIRGVAVAGFWAAFWGAIVYSIISWALSALVLGRPATKPK